MDQALIYTRDGILNKLEEWKSKKLEILWLLTYPRKHNIREILWKFTKKKWIEIGDTRKL